MDLHARSARFRQQHFNYAAGTIIAEKLTELLLMIGNAMFLHERDEIGGRVAGKCRLTEVWIGRDEILGGRIQVGEIASPAP